MEAYKFETVIQENGVIQIPEISKFADHQAEIFIVVKPKPKPKAATQQTVNDFLDKWRGLLEELDPDELKDRYLQEKYG